MRNRGQLCLKCALYALATIVAVVMVVRTPTRVRAQSNSPAAAYAFSEGSGTTTADWSGNNNAATVTTGATWPTGYSGPGVDLSTGNGEVDVPASETLQLTTAFTLEAWVYPTSLTTYDIIWRRDIPNASYDFAIRSGQLAFTGVLSTGSTSLWSPVRMTANLWTHVAATYDGAMLRLYMNGAEVANRVLTGSLPTGTAGMWIGGNFRGRIDELRVYRTALAANEVQLDMVTAVDPTAPFAVSGKTPVPGAIGVLTTPITVAFSRAADATSVSTSTVEVRDSGGAVVPASVSYDAATHRATLTPTGALASLSDYTIQVKGGSNGVLDTLGNGLATDVTWAFRTASAITAPVAAYAFSEGAGTTTADWSGNNNTATVTTDATWPTGYSGPGVGLSTGNGEVDVPASETLQLTTAFTLEAWVYPTSLTTYDIIWRRDIPNASYDFAIRSGQLAFTGVLSTGSTSLWSPVAMTANTWTHVAVTYDGAMLRLYMNGTEVANRAVTGSLPTGAAGMWIGGNFRGRIDELRVYRTALTASDVLLDMTTPVDTTPPLAVSAKTPLPGASGVVTTPITAGFNRPVDPETVTATTVELRDSADAVVSAAVSYDAAAHRATLTPVSYTHLTLPTNREV